MRYDPAIHHRCSIRLAGYDYSLAEAYFLTIVSQNRVCRFGKIVDGEIELNDAGRMIDTEWNRLPNRFQNLRLGEYIIMPNHIHGILILVAPDDICDVGATLVVAHEPVAPGAFASDVLPLPPDAADYDEIRAGTRPAPASAPKSVALGEIIGAFKSITTHAYILGVRQFGWPAFDGRLWQRNYYEHIIRNGADYDHIQDYILGNPAYWREDQLHPDAAPNCFNP